MKLIKIDRDIHVGVRNNGRYWVYHSTIGLDDKETIKREEFASDQLEHIKHVIYQMGHGGSVENITRILTEGGVA